MTTSNDLLMNPYASIEKPQSPTLQRSHSAPLTDTHEGDHSDFFDALQNRDDKLAPSPKLSPASASRSMVDANRACVASPDRSLDDNDFHFAYETSIPLHHPADAQLNWQEPLNLYDPSELDALHTAGLQTPKPTYWLKPKKPAKTPQSDKPACCVHTYHSALKESGGATVKRVPSQVRFKEQVEVTVFEDPRPSLLNQLGDIAQQLSHFLGEVFTIVTTKRPGVEQDSCLPALDDRQAGSDDEA